MGKLLTPFRPKLLRPLQEVASRTSRAPIARPSNRFRVQGLGFRVQGLGFRVQGSGFRI